MENVEITVKVNGKEVDLSTISTETFEKVKAATEVKRIPVARMACLEDEVRYYPRLILYVPELTEQKVVALDAKTGRKVNWWDPKNDFHNMRLYTNVQELK